MTDGIFLNEVNRNTFNAYMEAGAGEIKLFRKTFFAVFCEGIDGGVEIWRGGSHWTAPLLARFLRNDMDARNALSVSRPIVMISCSVGRVLAPQLSGDLQVPVLAATNECQYDYYPKPGFSLTEKGGAWKLFLSETESRLLSQGASAQLNLAQAVSVYQSCRQPRTTQR
jgi:hypothetical protein